MGSNVLGENQNVIHIDKTEGEVSKNLNHSLKPLACISQAKRKPEELTHTKGGMMSVFWMSKADIGT